MSEPFIAEIRIVPYNFAPRGWAFCDGQLLAISQNTALFSLVGTTYGGDGRTTVGLPNLQGRAPLHPGRGPGLTARRLGENGGSATVTLTDADVPAHTHSVNASTFPAQSADPTGAVPARTIGGAVYNANTGSRVPMAPEAVGSAGEGLAHNNLQPYLTLHFVIALVGIYPPRE